MNDVFVKRLDATLEMPAPAHGGDAGADVRTREAFTLEPGTWRLVPLGFALSMPNNCVAYVMPRSGLAVRNGVTVLNSPGVIDSGYRGEVNAVLINHGGEAVEFERGDRVAQIIISEMSGFNWQEVSELDETERGTGGFGSTGVK